MDPQVIKDITRFAEQFDRDKCWGTITLVFRMGVPMSIEATVNQRVTGPAQAALAKGEKPNAIEYRNR